MCKYLHWVCCRLPPVREQPRCHVPHPTNPIRGTQLEFQILCQICPVNLFTIEPQSRKKKSVKSVSDVLEQQMFAGMGDAELGISKAETEARWHKAEFVGKCSFSSGKTVFTSSLLPGGKKENRRVKTPVRTGNVLCPSAQFVVNLLKYCPLISRYLWASKRLLNV